MRLVTNAQYLTMLSILKLVCLIHFVACERDITTELLSTITDSSDISDIPESCLRSKIPSNTEMSSGGDSWKTATTVYEFTANNIQGEPVSLGKYEGKVLLIVNVASKCGLTSKNYAELVELDEKYREKGLRILAFPCNQFAGQEPGTSEQVCAFAKKKNVNFDMFDKIDVNGDNAHPLWNFLKTKQPGTFGNLIKWNFTKFLVDKSGVPVDRFAPTTGPLSIADKIEALLQFKVE